MKKIEDLEKKTIAKLFKSMGGAAAFTVHSIFVELGSRILPYLIEAIPSATDGEFESISLILQDLQFSNHHPAPHLYRLLQSGEEAQRVRVLKVLIALHPPLHEILPPLVQLLDDVSTLVRHEARAALDQLIHQLPFAPFSLEVSVQDALVTTFRIAPESERTVISSISLRLSVNQQSFLMR